MMIIIIIIIIFIFCGNKARTPLKSNRWNPSAKDALYPSSVIIREIFLFAKKKRIVLFSVTR